jgi:hypothetical protein
MKLLRAGLVCLGLAALSPAAAVVDASPAQAQCSVFDRRPCNPTGCSVFQRRPCLPQFPSPIGEDLRLTIETVPADKPNRPERPDKPETPAVVGQAGDDSKDSHDGDAQKEQKEKEQKLNTILQMYDALRACWVPPPPDEARAGMQMSVRFSFKRTGEIIGTPRVTYATPGAPQDVRETYQHAITDSLAHCTPLPFTAGLGGAVAGRPINVRFVDNRKLDNKTEHP